MSSGNSVSILLVLVLAAAGVCSGCSKKQPNAPTAKWQQKENWKQIRPSMTQQQVRDILGEPTASTSDPAFTQWTYGEGPQSGKVSFAGGMLRDWTSPK